MQFSIPPDLMRKPWTHEDKIKLIELAEKYDVLWNTTYPFYRELTQRKKALEEIKEALDNRHSVEDINSQWRNLKDVFYKKQSLMEQKEALGENPGEPIWRYYQPLKFLLSCEEERKNILRKRFHGNYELAQLRQLRLRRSQAMLSGENRKGANNQSEGFLLPTNNVVLNAFKNKMKAEGTEGITACNLDHSSSNNSNLNLDLNLSETSPPSFFTGLDSSPTVSFHPDYIKKEVEDEDENERSVINLYMEDDNVGGEKFELDDTDDNAKEMPSMSANDTLLAAVSAASTSALSASSFGEDELIPVKKAEPLKERTHYNGHYNENSKRVLMSRYKEWRKRQHGGLISPTQRDNPFTVHQYEVNVNMLSQLRHRSSRNNIKNGIEHRSPESKISAQDMHIRHCMLYEFNQKNCAMSATKKICEIYGPKTVDESTCRTWFNKFRVGCLNLVDSSQSAPTDTASVESKSSSPELELEEDEPQLKMFRSDSSTKCRQRNRDTSSIENECTENTVKSASVSSSSTETGANSSKNLLHRSEDNCVNKFKYFSMYVESALLDLNQQSPAIARRLVQDIYASIAKHQSQLID